MKHRELTDHIKGSFLKQQYLEAFLVQSAYIEGLLKILADYHLFDATWQHSTQGHHVIAAARSQIEGMSLSRLVTFNVDAKLISKEQAKLLEKYRIHRNRTIHNLLKELEKDEFDAELKEVCELGNKIIEGKEFVLIGEMLDDTELPTESEIQAEHIDSKTRPARTTKTRRKNAKPKKK